MRLSLNTFIEGTVQFVLVPETPYELEALAVLLQKKKLDTSIGVLDNKIYSLNILANAWEGVK